MKKRPWWETDKRFFCCRDCGQYHKLHERIIVNGKGLCIECDRLRKKYGGRK